MNASPDLLMTALKMFFALGTTIAVLLLLFKFTKGFIKVNGGKSGHGKVKVLSSTYLGVKKSISLVEIPGAILVLGIAGDTISLLSTIDDPETLETIKVPAGDNGSSKLFKPVGGLNFRQMLSRKNAVRCSVNDA